MILQEFNKENIKKFSDIKLKDYSSTFENICSNKSGGQVGDSTVDSVNKTPDNMVDNKKLDNTKQQEFLKKYAENLRKMLDTINVEQEKLLNILNEIFVYVFDSNKKQIIINPELTNESLDKIVIKTREAIIGLYLQCESDYIDGLKLYQALIESQMFINEGSKVNNLSNERERLYTPSSKPPQQPYQSKYSSSSPQPAEPVQPAQPAQPQYRPSMYDMNKQQKPDERQRIPNDRMNKNEMY